VGLFSAWWSFFRVFLYHHAAAIPPARAEATAITPSLIHAEAGGPSGWAVDEVSDSKEFATSMGAPCSSVSSQFGSRSICALDASHRGKFTFRPWNLISIFVFDFDPIYAKVYIFQ
jgi:hypothetical protein